MFKKILFPTDKSPHSEKAQNFAIDLAQRYNSELILLSVYKLPTQLYTAESIYYNYLNEIEDKIVDIDKIFLENIKKETDSKGIKTKILIEKGNIAHTIVDKSIEENCDLIVMGTRGLNAIERALIGSVSNSVVHNAKCSVMLI